MAESFDDYMLRTGAITQKTYDEWAREYKIEDELRRELKRKVIFQSDGVTRRCTATVHGRPVTHRGLNSVGQCRNNAKFNRKSRCHVHKKST